MRIADLPEGVIIWSGFCVIGVKGKSLEAEFGNTLDDAEADQRYGDPFNYDLVSGSITNTEAKERIDQIKHAFDFD